MQSAFPKNQRILITGGTKGIGLACAVKLANADNELCVIGNSDSGIALASHYLDRAKHRIEKIDLLTDSGLDAFARLLRASFKADIVIHAIGGIPTFDRDTPDSKVWQHVFRLNLFSVIEMNEILLSVWKENKRGKIVHISSSAAIHGKASVHYASAKAALNQYIKSKGRSLAPKGTILSGIMPGATHGYEGYWDRQRKTNTEKFQAAAKAQPTGNFLSADDVAAAVAFLCSEKGDLFAGCVLPADPEI